MLSLNLINHTVQQSFLYLIYSLTITGMFYQMMKRIKMKKPIFIEFLYQILITIVLAYIVRLIDNKAMLEAINRYGKITLVVFILLTGLLIKEILTFTKSYHSIKSNYCNAVYFLLLTVLFYAISVGGEIVWYIVLFPLLYLFRSLGRYEEAVDMKESGDFIALKQDETSDVPISSYNKLFPTRKKEFNRIYKFLNDLGTDDPYAIAISGSWGEGKTSFMNAIINKFKQENNKVIYIQPMVIDTRESLIKYVFGRLEALLIENGIFTGKGSPYKKYFNLLLNFVNNKTIINFSAFFDIFPEDKKEDLRELKEDLENHIERLVSENKRIYLIVDDLDRVEIETVYSTLTFIKEIVDFKKITVIFLVDYENLVSEHISIEYLEKFINTRFQLKKIKTYELATHYLKAIIPTFKTDMLNDEIEILRVKYKDYIEELNTNLNDLLKRKDDQLQELLKKKEKGEGISEKFIESERETISNIAVYLNDLNIKLSNARYVKKIIIEIKETFDFIEDNIKNGQKDIIVENNEILVNQLILKLNIFKTLFKEDFDDVIKEGSLRTYLKVTDNLFLKTYFGADQIDYKFGNKDIQKTVEYNFYDQIIFSDEIADEIFLKIKSKNEKLIDEIDTRNVFSKAPVDFEQLVDYLEAINYSTNEKKEDIKKQRIEIFTELMVQSLENGKMKFEQVFELFSNSHRNKLFESPVFFNAIKMILDEEKIELSNKKAKTLAQYHLDNIKSSLLTKMTHPMLMILSLYFMDDKKFSFGSLRDSLNGINKLKEFNELLSEIVEVSSTKNELGSLDYLKEVLIIIDNTIVKNIKNNHLEKRGYEFFKEQLETYISILILIRGISQRLNHIPINKNAKFEYSGEFVNTEEAVSQINSLYQHVVGSKEAINYRIIYFFHMLLNNIGWILTDENQDRIGIDNVTKLKEIFVLLDESLGQNPDNYESDSWHYCMIKLGEIERKENNIK
ncbi:P-loop NTPase fold protein [Rummeliibacillus pycnus]|uniref:KAP family P-loop NTPase fold protein n=1 Tax=Rummeliibacillus pycnus TaxID=101070 RepID=UPI0037C81743